MTVVDHLARYGALTAEGIRARMPADASVPYLVEPVLAYPARGGKAIRPSLLLATCEAFGEPAASGLPSAVAIEMLHNAFLVHDDIEDASELRRGAPTLHRHYGTALALNAGDALALFGYASLHDNVALLGPRLAQRIAEEFSFMSRQTVDGQALELGWRESNRLDLTPADYLDLIMKKTCWYTTVLPLRVGALIGSGGSADLEPMIRFGFHLGAAFQIQDDVLNVTADEAVYGKERLGDLIEGKRTLMLIHLAAAAEPADRRWLEEYLGRPPADRRRPDAEAVLELMHAYGSVAFAREFARGVARSAALDLDVAFAGVADSPARRFVRDLVPFMVDRAF